MAHAHKKLGYKKYSTVRYTKLRKGYKHLRELTPQELDAWFTAIERACNRKQ